MTWEQFWDKLLEKDIGKKIAEMDKVDADRGNNVCMKDICSGIYNDYITISEKLISTKKDILDMLEGLPGVHLHSSRIKTVESLIEKIVRKRYLRMFDKDSGYANISADTYKNVVTDLVGLRIIINYRGFWLDMHNEILKRFPYADIAEYQKDKLIPIADENNIQAEIPKVYYAMGDDVSIYSEHGLITKQHEMNYRSIHYTVIYNGFYVEIQMRTIYDEAWCDCNHSYVYKKDDNKSHEALESLSVILSKLTNLSSDIGETIKNIYDREIIDTKDGQWIGSQELIDCLDEYYKKINNLSSELNEFKQKIVVKKM